MQSFTIFKSFLQKKLSVVLILASLFCFSGMVTSCGGPKSGCPVNERAKVKTNKKGELSSKGGKSNLFPKKMRKKKKK